MNNDCKICNETFKSCQSLARHIKDKHNMSTKDYFDLYLATDDNNHLCKVCKKRNKIH